MTVYGVFYNHHEGTELLKLFDTQEKANEYLREVEKERLSRSYISKYTYNFVDRVEVN